MPANAITRARAQEQGIAPEEVSKPKETSDPKVDKVIPLDYPNAEVELERLKALQEWIDEERIRFESRRGGRKPISISQEGNVMESHQLKEPRNELTQPTFLRKVLNTQVQISLSTLLNHVPSLKTDLVAWLETERGISQEEVRCDFIEEGADRQKIAITGWEGDASNVMLPITYKNYDSVTSIVDGGSGINIIAKKLYDA